MSSISNISSLSNLLNLQPASSAPQRVGAGDSDGDGDNSRGAGGVGKSNFMNAIQQALGQSVPGSLSTSSSSATSATAPTSATQDPQAALQAFLQNLLASLGQTNASPVGGSQAAGSDADGDSDGSKSVSGVGRHGSNISANIQNLLQQLTASNPNTPASTQSNDTDPVAKLNSSFQNLMNSLNVAQGQNTSGANAPTLQTFLQNLYQDMGNGQNISGALVSATA